MRGMYSGRLDGVKLEKWLRVADWISIVATRRGGMRPGRGRCQVLPGKSTWFPARPAAGAAVAPIGASCENI